MITGVTISLYGVDVDSGSDEFKTACEARALLSMPLENRRREIEARARKRSSGDPKREGMILAELQAAVTIEWKWRREHRDEAA